MGEEEQIAALDEYGAEAVLDGSSSDSLSAEDAAPPGLAEDAGTLPEDAAALRSLLQRAADLHGPNRDPKLQLLITCVRQLLDEGFRPVVFCRFIPTAHYVAEHLTAALNSDRYYVETITGQLPPEERRSRIDALAEVAASKMPVLVATDSLSEGVNLQSVFSAVIHYDLCWNPTRHEQREGRIDRLGQPEKRVRALMLYGENNPVDGAILKVILRKAERIRKALGIPVPVPADTNKITEAILQTVLLRTGKLTAALRQGSLDFDFGQPERELDFAWQSARENARQTRTVFVQVRLKPEEVLPE